MIGGLCQWSAQALPPTASTTSCWTERRGTTTTAFLNERAHDGGASDEDLAWLIGVLEDWLLHAYGDSRSSPAEDRSPGPPTNTAASWRISSATTTSPSSEHSAPPASTADRVARRHVRCSPPKDDGQLPETSAENVPQTGTFPQRRKVLSRPRP